MDRSESLDLKLTKDGLEAAFRTEVKALERDSSVTAEAVTASTPGPVEPTGSQKALPEEDSESSEPGVSDSPVRVRQLLALGADWGGLINEAKQLLDDTDIPLPDNHSSLGDLLLAFEDEWPSILPERTENLAAAADELLGKLMAADAGEVKHEDVRLFSSALSSLHVIISKAASKVRHPSRSHLPRK
jgi:hypothetical protein